MKNENEKNLFISDDGETLLGCREEAGTGISVPFSVTRIEAGAFWGCKLIPYIVVPPTVTEIGENAFRDCSNLSIIIILGNLTSVGEKLFYGCNSLREINLGITNPFVVVDSIFDSQFQYDKCTLLINMKYVERFKLHPEFSNFQTIKSPGKAYKQTIENVEPLIDPDRKAILETAYPYFHFNQDGTTLDRIDKSAAKNLVVPNGIIIISSMASLFVEDTEVIVLPRTVSSIGPFGCHSNQLKNVYVDKENKYFADVSGVLYSKDFTQIRKMPCQKEDSTYTILPKTKTICDGAFYNCEHLTCVTIPYDCESIGNYAFENCFKITNIDIPNSVKHIGTKAFNGCNSLKNIEIPSSVESLALDFAEDCNSLKSISVSKGNKHYYDYGGVLFARDGNSLIKYPSRRYQLSFDIPYGTNEIEEMSFSECRSLAYISIPNTVTTIKSRAFYNCNIHFVNIPSSVTGLADEAFYRCDKINRIEIDGVCYVGETDPFPHVDRDTCIIAVPAHSLGFYKSNKYWNQFENIIAKESQREDESIEIITTKHSCEYPFLELSLDGTRLINCERDAPKDLKIPAGVTELGPCSFDQCIKVKSIILPETVETISDEAFYRCINLYSISIPGSCNNIGWNAFDGCVNLKEIHIGIEFPASIDEDIFPDDFDYERCVLYVPFGTRPLYEKHPQFSKFKKIVTER